MNAAQSALAPDPNWKRVYKVGGIGLLASGVIFVVGAVLSMMIGNPPADAEGYLKSVAGHQALSFATFGLFALTDFLMVPGIIALYLALRHISRNAMLIAAGLMALYVVLDLAITEPSSLALVALTRHYAASASDAARAVYVSAASYALAVLPVATFYSYVISSIGFLIASIVMLKGVFSKVTAYVGIAACVEGIVGGFYLFVPALAVLLLPCLMAFALWSFLAGLRLYRLG